MQIGLSTFLAVLLKDMRLCLSAQINWSVFYSQSTVLVTLMLPYTKLRPVSDLTTLDTPSDDVIVNCLHECFMTDNIYTGVRTSTLVIVNPHKYVSSNTDSVLHNYAAEYRDTTPGRIPLPPHIFQLANNAYYHIKCVHHGCTPH